MSAFLSTPVQDEQYLIPSLHDDSPKSEGRKARWITLMALIQWTLSVQDQTIAFTNLTKQAAVDQAKYNKDSYDHILYWDMDKLNQDILKKEDQSVFATDQAQLNLDQNQIAQQNETLSGTTTNLQNELKSMGSAQSQDDQNAQGVLSATQFIASLLRPGG
jgi:hypothetical protein